MKTTKLLTTALAGLLAAAPTLQAALTYETIVQWGEAGGDSGIVSANTFGTADMDDTYDAGNAVNPTVGVNYYNSNTDRTPIFNGAHNAGPGSRYGGNNDILFWNGGDYFGIGSNTGTSGPNNTFANEAMFVWESANYLSLTGSSYTLDSITFEQKLRSVGNNAGDSASYRYILQDSGGAFHISQEFTLGASNTVWGTYGTATDGALTWSAYTPFDAGVDTIGAASTPSLTNFKSIGLWTSVVDVDQNWAEQQTRYFQVIVAVPEPSSTALLGLGGLALVLRRKRS
jgi:hypothetical protein